MVKPLTRSVAKAGTSRQALIDEVNEISKVITEGDHGEIQALKERLDKINQTLGNIREEDDINQDEQIDNEEVEIEVERQGYRTMMPTMSPYKAKDNIATYLCRLKYWLEASHIPKIDIKNTVLTVIVELAFEQLIAHFENLSLVTVEEIFEALETCFGCKKSIWHERLCFEGILQKTGESISDLVARIKSSAAKCKFSDPEQFMICRFLFALNDKKITERLVDKTDLDFNEAIRIATTMEDRKKLGNSFEHISLNKIEKSCWRCSNKGHSPENCKFLEEKCNSCQKKGHISKVCQKRKNDFKGFKKNYKSGFKNERKALGVSINSLSIKKANKEIILLDILGSRKVEFQLDCGADTSIMSLDLFSDVCPNVKLRATDVNVSGANGKPLNVAGIVEMDIRSKKVPLIIVKESLQYPLLGLDAMDVINPEWRSLFKTQMNVEVFNSPAFVEKSVEEKWDELGLLKELHDKFKTIFVESEKQKIDKYKVRIELKSGSNPIFRKNYEAPLAFGEQFLSVNKETCFQINLSFIVFAVSSRVTKIVTIKEHNNVIEKI